MKQQAWPLSECEDAPRVIDEFSAGGVEMFGHPDTFPLTFHVLRLRDSGAQTQGEGEEKQPHLLSLSVNSSHFQGYGDGVKENQKKKYRGAMEKKKKEKFFPPCALAGLQNVPLACCLVYVLCGKVPPSV